MKKWPYLYAFAAVALAGCAGTTVPNSGGGGGGGGGGVIDGRSVATVSLPANVAPQLDVYLLPGQGRALGDIAAVFNRIYFDDTNGNRAEDTLAPEIALRLNGFNAINRRINTPLAFGENSRRFVNLQLEVQKIRIDNGDGTFQEYTGSGGGPILGGNEGLFNNLLSVSTFYGRTTSLQLRINDAMLNHNGTNRTWSRQEFIDQNVNPTTGKITGFLSDYLAFDISQVPAKPQLQSPDAAGEDAQVAYFSGDSIALSQASNPANPSQPKVIEVLTPSSVIDGTFSYVGNNVNRVVYDLKQGDPSDPGIPPRLLTSLKGYIRPYSEVLANTGGFEFITLPKNVDSSKQDLVIIQRNLTAVNQPIIAMWFGEVDFAANPAPKFIAWSIDQVDNASRTNEIIGTLPKALLLGPGKTAVDTKQLKWWQNVREGDYTFTTAPPGLPTKYATGRFVCFRR